jgi:hypothetical protein
MIVAPPSGPPSSTTMETNNNEASQDKNKRTAVDDIKHLPAKKTLLGRIQNQTITGGKNF